MTRLCVPLTATETAEMIVEIDAAARAGAEAIELRLDYLASWSDEEITVLMKKAGDFPGEVIATCRISDEGGQWDGDESERISLLEHVGLSGTDYIDVEFEAWKVSSNIRQKIGLVCDVNQDSQRPRCRLILSKHDFHGTPASLERMLEDLRETPAHVVKLATKAESIVDALRMMDAVRTSSADRPTIGLAMGEAGLPSRVLAKKVGAHVTFASLSAGKESAPGQVSVAEMRELYRWETLTAETAVYGVIGCPVAHSMSPAILNAAFAETGHAGVYLPFRVEPAYEDFKAFVDGCLARPWVGLRGCSVTIPHKSNLLRYVEACGGEIEPLAARIGVANTLCVEPGSRDDGSDALVRAFNTDYQGALQALQDGMDCSREELRGRRVLVLGAGGVSRAIVAGLCDCGCDVTITNRTHQRAIDLAGEFEAQVLPWDHRGEHEAEIVVNCTSIGMWPETEDSPLPPEGFARQPVVFDTVYNPIETRLLREARAAACVTVDGAAMFVNQASAQFRLWTGKDAPVGLMREVVLHKLSHA